MLSRYGVIVIFMIDKEGGYDVMTKNFLGKCILDQDINACQNSSSLKKKLTTLENPVFTSVAFSKNSKRIVASSYDLVS